VGTDTGNRVMTGSGAFDGVGSQNGVMIIGSGVLGGAGGEPSQLTSGPVGPQGVSAKPAGVTLMASTAPSTAMDPAAVSNRGLRAVVMVVI
jgi:hypothetical protein